MWKLFRSKNYIDKTSIDEVKTKIVREVLTHFTQHGVFFKFFSFFFHKTAANIKLAEDIIDKIDKQPGYSFDEIKNTLLAIQPEQVGQAGFKKALQQIKNELIAEVSHQPTRS